MCEAAAQAEIADMGMTVSPEIMCHGAMHGVTVLYRANRGTRRQSTAPRSRNFSGIDTSSLSLTSRNHARDAEGSREILVAVDEAVHCGNEAAS